MPRLNDVIVHVTDSKGNELEEWGVQHLRNQNKMSAYVQSETDMQFRISIQPIIPFIAKDAPAAHNYLTRSRGLARPGFFEMEDEWEDIDDTPSALGTRDEFPSADRYITNGFYGPGQNSSRDYSFSTGTTPAVHIKQEPEDDDYQHSLSSPVMKHIKQEPNDDDYLHSLSSPVTKHIKREPEYDRQSFSKPFGRSTIHTPPPPFHLLASLYLDGRTKPERKVVIYLDPDDEDFSRPHGIVNLKTRWVRGTDGSLKEHGWVFRDVGIETVFDRMLIAGAFDKSKMNKQDEDDIVDAMNSAYLAEHGDPVNEEASKVGQIIVKVERVKLGEKWSDPDFRPKHREGEGEDVDMDGATRDITHTAGFKYENTMKPHPIRVVEFTPYREGEEPLATFQFFYRSQKQLERFNFNGFSKPTPLRKLKKIGGLELSHMTPLSISNPLKPIWTSSKVIADKDGSFGNHSNLKSKSLPTPSVNLDKDFRSHEKEIKRSESFTTSKDRQLLFGLPNSSPTLTPQSSSSNSPSRYNLRSQACTSSRESGNHSRSSPSEDTKATTSRVVKLKYRGSNAKPNHKLLGTIYQLPSFEQAESRLPSPQSAGVQIVYENAGRSITDLINVTDTNYRTLNNSSDADDEQDPSDLETHPGTDLESDGPEEDDGNRPSEDKDDEGLYRCVKTLALGKRSRGGEKSDSNRAVASSSDAGSALDGKAAEDENGDGLGDMQGATIGRRNALIEEDADKIRNSPLKRMKVG